MKVTSTTACAWRLPQIDLGDAVIHMFRDLGAWEPSVLTGGLQTWQQQLYLRQTSHVQEEGSILGMRENNLVRRMTDMLSSVVDWSIPLFRDAWPKRDGSHVIWIPNPNETPAWPKYLVSWYAVHKWDYAWQGFSGRDFWQSQNRLIVETLWCHLRANT